MPRVNKKNHEHTCEECGVKFMAVERTRRFCSRRHALDYANKQPKPHKHARHLIQGSIPYRVATYLEEVGVATEEEVAQHLGVSVRQVRGRLAPSRNRNRESLTERVVMLTSFGKQLLRKVAQR